MKSTYFIFLFKGTQRLYAHIFFVKYKGEEEKNSYLFVSEQCNIGVVNPNVSVVSSGPYYEGDVVQYACHENHVLSTGSLDRACLNSAALTGGNPECSGTIRLNKKRRLYRYYPI